MDDAFVFYWTIEQFTWCKVPTGKSINSPVFTADTPYQTHWRLKLYPRGLSDRQHISCYLDCHMYNESRERAVDFDISIVDMNNTLLCSSEMKNVLLSNRIALGFPQLVSWNYLLENKQRFLPEGTLRIQCRVKSALPAVQQVADLEALSKTFHKLLTLGCYSDITIRGKDAVFSVHRDVLFARAPKFGRKLNILQSKTKKSLKWGSEICVSDHLSDDVLRALLLYLYCGVMESTEPVVWDQLYEKAEAYELYDMKRDIFPTTTVSSVRTRIETFTKSISFTIKNFSTSTMACMGRLIDLEFSRVSVEYLLKDDQPGNHKVGFIIWCFSSDLECEDNIYCTVSVIDVNGSPHFTSEHKIMHDDLVTAISLPTEIKQHDVMNDLFLNNDDAIHVMFTFTVIRGPELLPTRIETQKAGSALCLGHESPGILTLRRLSEDFEKLMVKFPIKDIDPKWMKRNASSLHKGIFSAWSSEHAEVFRSSQKRKSLCPSKATSEICTLIYQFFCTGTITIPSLESAIAVYNVADAYKIGSLQKICLMYVESKLNIDNATMAIVWAFSNKNNCYTLIESFLCSNFELLAKRNEWQYLNMRYPSIVDNVTRRFKEQSSGGQTSPT